MTNDSNIQAAEGFTMMPNALIADQRVSLAAKALWAYIASKPEGWTFRRQAMAAQLGICVKSMQKLAKELIGAGWLERDQSHAGLKGFRPAKYRLCYPNSNVGNFSVHTINAHTINAHTNVTRNSNKEYSNKEYSNKDMSAALSKNAKIEAFKKQAKQAARQLNLPAEDAYKFVLYWTQQGRRKMLYEEQRGFDIEARLKMWALNEK
jgi:hypothetical protein